MLLRNKRSAFKKTFLSTDYDFCVHTNELATTWLSFFLSRLATRLVQLSNSFPIRSSFFYYYQNIKAAHSSRPYACTQLRIGQSGLQKRAVRNVVFHSLLKFFLMLGLRCIYACREVGQYAVVLIQRSARKESGFLFFSIGGSRLGAFSLYYSPFGRFKCVERDLVEKSYPLQASISFWYPQPMFLRIRHARIWPLARIFF